MPILTKSDRFGQYCQAMDDGLPDINRIDSINGFYAGYILPIKAHARTIEGAYEST